MLLGSVFSVISYGYQIHSKFEVVKGSEVTVVNIIKASILTLTLKSLSKVSYDELTPTSRRSDSPQSSALTSRGGRRQLTGSYSGSSIEDFEEEVEALMAESRGSR